MAVELKHAFVSSKADGSDNSLVQPSDWNAAHSLVATEGKLLGTSGSTTVGEITVGTGLSLAAGTLSASGGGGTAATTTFTPAGNLVADDVQEALVELDTEKAPKGAVTGSGLTMATARILGRTTASSGAVEEISVGSGLSLSGGSLTATGGSGGLGALRADRYLGVIGTSIPGNASVPSNWLYMVPVTLPSGTITRIVLNVMVAGAGNAWLGVYSCENGMPGALLVDGGSVSTTTTGLKEATVSLTVAAGPYFLAANWDTAAQFAAMSGIPNFLGVDASSAIITYMRRTRTYGTALPSNESGQTYNLVTLNPPNILVRGA